MLAQDVKPTFLVEDILIAKVKRKATLGVPNFLLGDDHTFEILLDDVLKAEKGHRRVDATTTFEESVDGLSSDWVLSPVTDLVAIGEKSDVVECIVDFGHVSLPVGEMVEKSLGQ